MTRGIWTKWIIFAALLLFIVAAGCILWYQHTTAQYQAEADKDDKLLKQWKADEAKPTITAETESTQAPAESTENTAEKPTNIIGEETETNTDKATEPVDIATQEQENTEEVKVSPHGFGEYPKVPEDYPKNVNWSYYEDKHPMYELMARVRIKLWKQGQQTDGIVEENGLLYPIMRNTVYVRWSDNGKYITDIIEHPADNVSDIIFESDTIPESFTVLDYEAGINPYEFLNLQGANSYDKANVNARSRFDK